MQEIVNGFALGLGSLDHVAILYILAASLIGTFAGAMPGLGAVSGVALMLPVALQMELQLGICFLVTISLGCSYGGRITAILINIPGDATAVVTSYDGYPMMQQGLGGKALGMSAFASFVGGAVSFFLLAICAPPIARFALTLGSAEYFSIMIFGFATVVSLTSAENVLKTLIFLFLGMLLSTVRVDLLTGFNRFVFVPELYEGISFVVVILGLYGLSEALFTAETKYTIHFDTRSLSLRKLLPTWTDIKTCIPAICHGTGLGSFVGTLPGAGGTIATFLSYAVEKGVSDKPEEFGKGKIQGVAGPEAANNAVVGSALIPMFSLGIPGSSVAAILMGVLIMYGLQPGPRIFSTSPLVVWTTIVGLMVANVMLLLTNTLLIPVFIQAIKVGQRYLKPMICVMCLFGVFAVAETMTAVWLAVAFAALGYIVKKLNLPASALIFSLILTPNVENYYRQTMLIYRGDYTVFIWRPVSLFFLVLSVAAILYPFYAQRRKRKNREADLTTCSNA